MTKSKKKTIWKPAGRLDIIDAKHCDANARPGRCNHAVSTEIRSAPRLRAGHYAGYNRPGGAWNRAESLEFGNALAGLSAACLICLDPDAKGWAAAA
jgi:hypothetical protein